MDAAIVSRIEQAAIKATEAGALAICEVAPSRFHVRVKEWQDSYADYSETHAAVAWSTNRIAALMQKEWPDEDPGQLRYRAGDFVRRFMSVEAKRQCIQYAAEHAGVELKFQSSHHGGCGYTREVEVSDHLIKIRTRQGIGD